MKRVSAFTIIELVISLLISSVVIGIVYYAFLFFSKQFGLYQRKSDSVQEYFLLKGAVQNEFEKAELIIDSLPGLIAFKTSMPDQMITYRIDSNFIVRKFQETADSFRVKCENFRTIHVNDSSNLVKEIVFSVKMDNSILETTITKRYSASQLILGEKIINE